MPFRIVLDVTTSAVWSGPVAGIVRVEREFAKWALAHLGNVVFAFFDPDNRTFRHLSRDILSRLLSEDAFVDVVRLTDTRRKRRRKTDRIPAAMRPFAMWLLQSRYMSLQALERLRLTTQSPGIASLADATQRAIINDKYAHKMIKADGSRWACFPSDIALGHPIEFGKDDLLICTGAGWMDSDIKRITTLKRSSGCHFILFCHDIIPLMFPQYFHEDEVELHRTYWSLAFPAADLVIFGSRTAEKDVRSYCALHGITLRATAVCSLGANAAATPPAKPLPVGLEPGRYALLVGTIEPRKGHRLIYEAWKDLMASGIPQRARFRRSHRRLVAATGKPLAYGLLSLLHFRGGPLSRPIL